LHSVFGPGLAAYYAFQIGTAAGLILVLYALASRWLGPRAAFYAAFVASFEPGLLLYQSYKLAPVAISAFFWVCGLFILLVLEEAPSVRFGLASGALLGFGVLTRPDLIALAAPVAAWPWRVDGRDRRLRAASAAAVAFLACLTPWLWRSHRLTG